MEATVIEGIQYTYNKSELNQVINNTIDVIKKVVKENNYQVNGVDVIFLNICIINTKLNK